MEKGRGKVAQLTGLRVALVGAFFAMGAVGILLLEGPLRPAAILVMAGAAGLLVYGVAKGNDGDVLAGWVVQVALWWVTYTFLEPAANLLNILALTSGSLAVLDVVHMVGLVYPMSKWRSTMTAGQTEEIWGLLSGHISHVAALSVATFVVSVAVLGFVFQLTPIPSQFFGPAIFAAAAIVISFLAVSVRRRG
jgi:hypothetical protein